MKFNTLAWSAVCFYYRSAGEKKYSSIMSDHKFLSQLRSNPKEIPLKELEEKAIIGFINIQNYDLLIKHKLTENILNKIVDLQDDVFRLQGFSLLKCDLGDQEIIEAINHLYSELLVINGLWITGASKVAHLLNDELLPPISLDISRFFGVQYKTDISRWLQKIKWDIQEATEDFYSQGFEGTPNRLLSEKLGYIDLGYEKSLIKFADEYYWLSYVEDLPIPPKWIPEYLWADVDNHQLSI